MLKLTIHSSSSWSASLYPLYSSSSSYMQRCWLSDGCWGGEVLAPPFMTYCYLKGDFDPPWPCGWEDQRHFWIWPGQNLAAFLLQRKLIISFHLGPASDALGRRPRAGLVGEEMLSENAGGGGPSQFTILLLLPVFICMIIFLFSLKTYGLF